MNTEIIKSNRRTIELQICTDGHLRVRAPYYMTDAEIAREMKLVHSTIRERRTRSLELLKKLMEENMDGAEE